MGPGGITVVLAMYWLNAGVEAVSLSPGDQYSPYQPPYRTNLAQGPLSYPNWLKYQQDLTTRLEPPDYTSGSRKADVNYVSKDRATQEDSLIPDLDILPYVPGDWKASGFADVRINSSESAAKNSRNLKHYKRVSLSNDDDDFSEDTFQDQGPGSVEVYKLDLHRESPLLVPHVSKQVGKGSRMKSKIPKKAMAEEIMWKLKPMDVNESPLPAIFRQPPLVIESAKSFQESRRTAKTYHNDEAFAVGGVPELQVGCEGLETAERQKRSKGSDTDKMDKSDDWNNVGKYQQPVYRESTEPILFRVTPIVLNNDEEEPPSGEVYEEMDALLKLKKSESTSPKPTTRRWNRADIDPALEMDKYQDKRTEVETFPERGDLGPTSNSSEGAKSTDPETSKQKEGTARFRRDAAAPLDSSESFVSSFKDKEDTAGSSLNRIRKANHRSGRKILWVQNSDGQGHDKPATSSRYHEDDNEYEEDDTDLWGFGEEDGALSDAEDEPDMAKLREAEIEKRRREYERRKQEELYRRREGMKGTHQPHPGSDNSKPRNVNMEIEKIRKDYERQLEKQRRERQRMPEERNEEENVRREEMEQRRAEEMRRQREKEARRKLEEEERRRDWNRRREEEERRRRLGKQQSHEDPPSPLVRIPSPNNRNMARSQQDKDDEERKLQDYIERNRPVDPRKAGEQRRPDEKVTDDAGRRRYMEYQERRRNEEERRRQQTRGQQRGQVEPSENDKQQRVEEDHERERQRGQLEEHRRRQHENERRRQLAEQQRQRENEERRRQIEEQRRRDRPENRTMEEERRRRLEEEKKLQEYVRRNQPVVVPKRNNSQASNTSSQGSDSEEQRRTIEAARQWDRSRRPSVNRNDGRVHGPSAPTNIGQRHPQDDQEDMRQRQERVKEEHLRESNRRRLEEEERRREAEYRRVESRRREEERKRLEQVRRADESRRAQSAERNNHRQGYGSSHRQAGQVLDRDAEELRRREPAGRTTDNAMRNQGVEWRRRSEERAAQQLEQQRERHRLENERNSRNNQRHRPHHEDSRPKTSQPSESVRGGYNEAEWRRREHARLNSLPVSARIILRSNGLSGKGGRTSSEATPSRPLQRLEPWIATRGSFDDDLPTRQGLSPNRPAGIEAVGFQVRSTSRPPVESPGPCVWAIVQCCPSNKRRTACFESMGCPGAHWDPNPCSSSLTDAARDEVVKFYAAADRRNTRN